MKNFILFLAISSGALAETPWEKKFKDYTKGLPKDVLALLERTDQCNHFGGEEAYSEKRQKEIEAAMAKHKCDQIDADTEKVKKKYKKQPKVIEKIQNFSNLQ